jgi:hypothetical protein
MPVVDIESLSPGDIVGFRFAVAGTLDLNSFTKPPLTVFGQLHCTSSVGTVGNTPMNITALVTAFSFPVTATANAQDATITVRYIPNGQPANCTDDTNCPSDSVEEVDIDEDATAL